MIVLPEATFQNIVCYCLSLTGFRICVMVINFKTSYVTVYRWLTLRKHQRNTNFKTSYVTVYRTLTAMTTFYLLFQNIVCYCLSANRSRSKQLRLNFKTSYVTVYRLVFQCFVPAVFISKHRMLLFIHSGSPLNSRIEQFQNIVCYCLSDNLFNITIDWTISKHRMLLFINIAAFISRF